MGKFVKLGDKASFFRDPVYDITISPKEVVELNVKQLNSPKVKTALNGGHLVFTQDPKESVKKEESKKPVITDEELKEAFLDMVNKAESKKKIVNTFSKDELIRIASTFDLQAEDDDTKDTLFDAIFEIINESK